MVSLSEGYHQTVRQNKPKSRKLIVAIIQCQMDFETIWAAEFDINNC